MNARHRSIVNSRTDYRRQLDVARADAWSLAKQCERQAEQVRKYADRCVCLEERVAYLEADNARLLAQRQPLAQRGIAS